MNRKKYVFLVLFLIFQMFLATVANNQPQEEAVTDFAYDSFRKVIARSLEKELVEDKQSAIPSGLIILLGEIDSANARNLLLQMLEVYIGEAHYETLSYAIVKQGKKIRKGLKNLLTTDPSCDFLDGVCLENKKCLLKCLTKEERNRNIYWLLDLIDKGRKLEYVL